MTAATFSHRDDGTPEAEWQRAFAERMPQPPEWESSFFEDLGHLIVVAAHPDDETLGAAGLLARAGASGVRVTVIVATSGEGSHPGAVDGRMLARRREDETRSAVAEVDAGATVHFLRLPDGGLSEHRFALAQAIADTVGPTAMAATAHPAAGDEVESATDRSRLPDAAANAGPSAAVDSALAPRGRAVRAASGGTLSSGPQTRATTGAARP